MPELRFVGSKGASGIAQWIISQMPAHQCYVEPFLGKGVIMRTKLPASKNIGIEADSQVISRYWRRRPKLNLTLLEGDALTILPAYPLPVPSLIYADPPYLGSVRNQPDREYYRFELLSEADHVRLLSLLTLLQSRGHWVMVSGYASSLYGGRLSAWRCLKKWTITRGGTRVQECLWLSFPEPALLHDTRFIGSDFTGRQQVKRKIARWRKKFLAMEPGERWAILEALSAVVNQPRLCGPHSQDQLCDIATPPPSSAPAPSAAGPQ